MKKDQATIRQINAVKEELDRKLRKAREDWHSLHPAPSWKEEQEWERRHRSPRRLHEDAEEKALQSLQAKHAALLFDARMGKITADELYARAKAL